MEFLEFLRTTTVSLVFNAVLIRAISARENS